LGSARPDLAAPAAGTVLIAQHLPSWLDSGHNDVRVQIASKGSAPYCSIQKASSFMLLLYPTIQKLRSAISISRPQLHPNCSTMAYTNQQPYQQPQYQHQYQPPPQIPMNYAQQPQEPNDKSGGHLHSDRHWCLKILCLEPTNDSCCCRCCCGCMRCFKGCECGG
jgi:hypothetical protein